MNERTKTVLAFVIVATVVLAGLAAGSFGTGGDIFPSEDTRIMLYGESHGNREYYELELGLWQECYENGCRDLFMELPYYTAEYLNIWMKMSSDGILDAVFSDLEGTLSGNEYFRQMLCEIKRTCPDTVFYGTDVGHQYDTTGRRYLAFLEENGLADSQYHELAEECVRQGMEFYGESDPTLSGELRERCMISNFISAYSRCGEGRIMGIYGSWHTDPGTPGVMFAGLREHYGDIISSVRLSTLATQRSPYRIGLCLSGLVFLLMLVIPNVLWARGRQPAGYEHISGNENRILLALERAGEAAVSACLLLFRSMGPSVRLLPEGLFIDPRIILWIASFLLMILYECWWIRYFRSERTLEDFYSSFAGFPVAGASLPVTATLILGIYSGNAVMIVSGLILGIGHIGIHLMHRKEVLQTPEEDSGLSAEAPNTDAV